MFIDNFSRIYQIDEQNCTNRGCDFQNDFVLTIGTAASGKSTYIHNIFPLHRRISMDKIRGIYSLDPADKKQTVFAFDLCYPILLECLQNGVPAAWDATSVKSEIRSKLIDTAVHFNAKITLVFFDIPLSEIQRRNDRRVRKVPRTAILRQWNELEPPHSYEADCIVVVE
jgi:predicted kinase